MSDLAHLDATTAIARFKRLELSPVELLDAIVDQTERVNGDRSSGVNAFTETLHEEARNLAGDAADAYARAARTGTPLPLLLGIPVATKEKHALAGHTIEQGLLAHRGRRSSTDHPVVARIRRSGGIVHARTTSPEFSCATVTHSPMWGITRNPWNLETTPGGSSGGAGAALAAGMTTLATASDIAGSTRVPAGFTATVGYKPPYGRIPGSAPLSADWYRSDGPMARTVADVALLASVMSGRHADDHASWGSTGVSPLPNPVDANQLRGLRIGVSLTLGDFPVEPDVAAATLSAAAHLEQAGAEIITVDLPWNTAEIRRTIFAHFGQILGPAIEREAGDPDGLAPYTRRFIEDARRGAERHTLVDSLALDANVQHVLATAMAPLDVLVCPTNAVTSLRADGDYLDGIDVADRHLEHYWESHLTSPFNVANRCPVLSVPAGLAANGVPIGMQIVGHPFDEATTFMVAAALEQLVTRERWPLQGASSVATRTGAR